MNKNIHIRRAEFIEKSIRVHGNKFDYSKVIYYGSHKKVSIICNEHGVFEQSPTNHLSGNGCPKCAWKYSRGKYRLTSFETFLNKANEIHSNKYDYSRVEWINIRTKITIICPIHGEFTQIPQNHIRLKSGCRRCGREIVKSKLSKYNTEFFLTNAKKIHGDKYDYSNTQCFNATDKVQINCYVHGVFHQRANSHLKGNGCPKCNFDQMAKDRAMGKELFINKSKELFGDKYDYSKVEYINGQINVSIICAKHGEFEVTPNNHLSKKSGCPICNESKLERELSLILDNLNIEYERQKKFKWLGRLSLDFYLPEFEISIECQGVQHFKPIDFAGKGVLWAVKSYEKIKKNDDLKLNKCLEQNLKMIYIIDNDIFLEEKYHFIENDPFTSIVNYQIMNINSFQNYLIYLKDVSNYFNKLD